MSSDGTSPLADGRGVEVGGAGGALSSANGLALGVGVVGGAELHYFTGKGPHQPCRVRPVSGNRRRKTPAPEQSLLPKDRPCPTPRSTTTGTARGFPPNWPTRK